jgi:hypothetical protein
MPDRLMHAVFAFLALVIIPPDRRIEWQPGIPGGVPHYPFAVNVKDAPFSARGDGAADDTAAIQAAIKACPDGRAVHLPAEARYQAIAAARAAKSTAP